MNWLGFVFKVVSELPVERLLCPPPNRVKALRELVDKLGLPADDKPSEAEVRDKVRVVYRGLGELRGLVDKGLVSEDLLVKVVDEEKPK